MTTSHHPFDTLTPEFIMDAVESRGFRCDCRTLALNSYENRVYQVGIEEGKPLIAKFYRPDRWSDDQILEEHRFCLELAEHELPVVVPVVRHRRRRLISAQGLPLRPLPPPGGHAPEFDNLDNLEDPRSVCWGASTLLDAVRPFVAQACHRYRKLRQSQRGPDSGTVHPGRVPGELHGGYRSPSEKN